MTRLQSKFTVLSKLLQLHKNKEHAHAACAHAYVGTQCYTLYTLFKVNYVAPYAALPCRFPSVSSFGLDWWNGFFGKWPGTREWQYWESSP